MKEKSHIPSHLEQGDPYAAEEILPLVYDELRRLAAQKLAQEAPGQTLQATALVHEAYVRLVQHGKEEHWNSRGHFFAAAAEAMRRILVDNARRKKRVKHGGDRRQLEFDNIELIDQPPHENLLALDEALSRLAVQEPAKAEIVKLRYFAGLTIPEIAEMMEISLATAERYWKFARLWLYAELHDSNQPGENDE